jgi:hypothetical protein
VPTVVGFGENIGAGRSIAKNRHKKVAPVSMAINIPAAEMGLLRSDRPSPATRTAGSEDLTALRVSLEKTLRPPIHYPEHTRILPGKMMRV